MGADTNELGRKANVPNTKASYLPQSALGVIHQRRCSDLFGSLVDSLMIKVRPKVILRLIYALMILAAGYMLLDI